MTDLAQKNCDDLGTLEKLGKEGAASFLGHLDSGWTLDGDTLTRRYKTSKFAPALMMANAVGYVAEDQGHHPDMALGWGYLEVKFTTHDVGGLSEKDFICAAKLDAMGLAG